MIEKDGVKIWSMIECVRSPKHFSHALKYTNYINTAFWQNRLPDKPGYWFNIQKRGSHTEISKKKLEKYIERYYQEKEALNNVL